MPWSRSQMGKGKQVATKSKEDELVLVCSIIVLKGIGLTVVDGAVVTSSNQVKNFIKLDLFSEKQFGVVSKNAFLKMASCKLILLLTRSAWPSYADPCVCNRLFLSHLEASADSKHIPYFYHMEYSNFISCWSASGWAQSKILVLTFSVLYDIPERWPFSI